MIKSFSHKALEKFFYDGIKKGIQAKHAKRIALILDYLDAAEFIEDMNFPGLDSHILKGKKRGYFCQKFLAKRGVKNCKPFCVHTWLNT